MQATTPSRFTRRVLGRTAGRAGLAAGLFGLMAGSAALNAAPALAGASAAPGKQVAPMQPFPAGASPFDAGERRNLALDCLTFFAHQAGLFVGRGVTFLPGAPWFGGNETPSVKHSWDLTIPGGQAIYLLAYADPTGKLDPAATTITVNGTALTDLAAYVHGGVGALHQGQMRDHAVLDLVFAPPAPGQYQLEVKTRQSATEAAGTPSGSAVTETTLAYSITVDDAVALGPLLFQDGAGRVYATDGPSRRLVPDPDTLTALSYPASSIVTAADAALVVLPEGAPLPSLRGGMLMRADNHSAVFRLQGSTRRWLKSASGASSDPAPISGDVQTVPAPVLAVIPPALQDGLLFKGQADDVYHVDGEHGNTCRKIPDWKWVKDQNLNPADTVFVADRLIPTLPNNSPEWRMPGGAWQDRSFDSQALSRPMPYRIYLPSSYGTSPDQRYPVIYLLHGLSARYDEWSGYGAEEIANDLLKDGKFVQTIIVAPQGGLGYWTNQEGGGTRWGDYVARDLVDHLDTTYRTIAKREARAIGGLSMGAHGAMQLAMNFPDVFGVVGVHSPSIRSEDIAPAYFGKGAVFAKHDPISLVKNSQIVNPPRIWVDAGDRDSWRTGAEALHKALTERGWAHEWHLFQGDHDGWYWGDHLWDYLAFYAAAFAQNGVPLLK